MTDKTPTLILFEHEDGRYGIAPEGQADFTNGEPKWHRLGPVEVVRLAAEPSHSGSAVEAVAQAIYDQWRVHLGFRPWVPGGNSLKQDEARDIARAALSQPVIAAPVEAKLPAGWVPLTITFEGDTPEDVAYGPQIMMDRLKIWLDKFYALRLAAPTLAEPAQQDTKGADHG